MIRLKMIAAFAFITGASSTVMAQDFCSTALTSQAYDRQNLTTQSIITSEKRAEICSREFDDEREARSSAVSAGFSGSFSLFSAGASGAQSTSESRYDVSETAFCKSDLEDITSSNASTYESQVANIAVNAWLQCIEVTKANRMYLDYEISRSGRSFTGMLNITTNTGRLQRTITGISVDGDRSDVTCDIDGQEYTPAEIEENPVEIVVTRTPITCRTSDSESASIAIATDADGIPFIHLPNEEDERVLDYDRLQQQIDELREENRQDGLRILGSGGAINYSETLEWTLIVPQADRALLLVTGFASQLRQTDMVIEVDGERCSVSYSIIESAVDSAYAPASCVMILEPGSHTIESKINRLPDTPVPFANTQWVALKLQE